MVARHECAQQRAPVAQILARRLLAVVLGILSLHEGMALHSPLVADRKLMRRQSANHLAGTHQLKQGLSTLELFPAGTAAPLAARGPPSPTNSGGFEIGAAGSIEAAAASATTGLQRTRNAASSLPASAPVSLSEAKLSHHDSRHERSEFAAIPAEPSGTASPPEQQDNAFKILPAQSFVIGSTGIDTDNLLAEDQALVTTPPAAAPPAAAPVAAAVVAPVPAAAGTAAPAVAVAAVPAAITATAAPVAPVAQAAPAVPAAAAAAAVPVAAPAAATVAPAGPTVVAQGAATDSSGSGGGYMLIVMLLLIGVILLGAIFAVRAKMQKPPAAGRLTLMPSTSADGQDSQFWKSAKARQSYRKSHSQPALLDSDAEESADGKSSTPDTGKRRSSRDGRARRQSTTAAGVTGSPIKSTDNSGTDEAGNAAASASSYRGRRERGSILRNASADNKGKPRAAQISEPPKESVGDATDPGNEGKVSSYRGRRTQLQGAAATSPGQPVSQAAATSPGQPVFTGPVNTTTEDANAAI